jgi:phosphatidylcholine synthase
VAFYLFLLQWSAQVNAAILLTFAVLVFVPLRYVYPSRTQTLSLLTNVLGAGWAVLALWMLWRLPSTDGPWTVVSLAFPVYYMALSLWLSFKR